MQAATAATAAAARDELDAEADTEPALPPGVTRAARLAALAADDGEDSDDEDAAGHGTDGTLASTALDLVRKFAGEQTAGHIVRAQQQAAEKIARKVNKTRDKVASRLGRLGEDVTGHLAGAGMEARRRLFAQLFATEDGDSADGDLEAQIEPLWRERSASWVDTMQPQGRLWFAQALPTSLLGADADLSFAFDPASGPEPDMIRQIELDLPRTFPSIDYFEDATVVATFRRTLRAVAVTSPEVGYVQGMNFLVGYMLLHCKTEQEAHRLALELLSNPKYQLRGVFEDGLPTLRKLSATLKDIVEAQDAALGRHLEAQGFSEYFFAFQWISTLFAYSMPFDALQLVWDLFFERSWEGFFAVCVTLMRDQRPALLASGFDGVCAKLKLAAANPREGFDKRARAVTFSPALRAKIHQAFATATTSTGSG